MTQIQHSRACEGHSSVLYVQEHECAEGLQYNRGQGFAEPRTCLGCSKGHSFFESNCSWQLFSFHPAVKTATLKKTSLCKTSHHKTFLSSFPEARHKPDSEGINLCGIKEESSVL